MLSVSFLSTHFLWWKWAFCLQLGCNNSSALKPRYSTCSFTFNDPLFSCLLSQQNIPGLLWILSGNQCLVLLVLVVCYWLQAFQQTNKCVFKGHKFILIFIVMFHISMCTSFGFLFLFFSFTTTLFLMP